MGKSLLLSGLLILLCAGFARGQTTLPPPPQIPYGVPITTAAAKMASEAAIAEGRQNGWSMAIAIVDPGGHLVYFERMQDTQIGSINLAIDKATTSALFRRPTKVFQDAVVAGGANLRVLRLTGTIPNEGGIPLIVDGKVIGAIGVSGGSGDQDGQVARAGAAIVK